MFFIVLSISQYINNHLIIFLFGNGCYLHILPDIAGINSGIHQYHFIDVVFLLFLREASFFLWKIKSD